MVGAGKLPNGRFPGILLVNGRVTPGKKGKGKVVAGNEPKLGGVWAVAPAPPTVVGWYMVSSAVFVLVLMEWWWWKCWWWC